MSTLIGHSLKPEELRHRQGADDPIRLPVEIGKFLEAQSSNELVASWGAILGSPDPSLLTPQGGFSTATGRLATLSVCCEAMQGPPNEIDTAVQLALHRNAWEHCREVAKTLAQQGALHAPKIALVALKQSALPTTSGPLPKPNILGGLALQQILPPEMAFLVPSLFLPPEEEVEEEDLIAHLDMIFVRVYRKEPFYTAFSTNRQSETIQPALQSTNHLLNALGRTQVEMATASVAVHRVNPQAPLLSVLEHCDTVLRKIARRTVSRGQNIGKCSKSAFLFAEDTTRANTR